MIAENESRDCKVAHPLDWEQILLVNCSGLNAEQNDWGLERGYDESNPISEFGRLRSKVSTDLSWTSAVRRQSSFLGPFMVRSLSA